MWVVGDERGKKVGIKGKLETQECEMSARRSGRQKGD